MHAGANLEGKAALPGRQEWTILQFLTYGPRAGQSRVVLWTRTSPPAEARMLMVPPPNGKEAAEQAEAKATLETPRQGGGAEPTTAEGCRGATKVLRSGEIQPPSRVPKSPRAVSQGQPDDKAARKRPTPFGQRYTRRQPVVSSSAVWSHGCKGEPFRSSPTRRLSCAESRAA
jgi:hypothetical protein